MRENKKIKLQTLFKTGKNNGNNQEKIAKNQNRHFTAKS